jgi:hypothetical protein
MGGQFVGFSPSTGIVVTRIGHVLDEWVESFSPTEMIDIVLSAINDRRTRQNVSFDKARSLADENAGEDR